MTKAMANAPSVLKGYLDFSGDLSKGKLDAQLREQIAFITARSTECNYRLSAHTVIGRMVGLDETAVSASRHGKDTSDGGTPTANEFRLDCSLAVQPPFRRRSSSYRTSVSEVPLLEGAVMHVSEIWRYPIKSMRGERIESANVLQTGVAFDRNIVCVSEARRRVLTARTHPGLLGLQGSVSEGITTVEGVSWNSQKAAQLASEAAGEKVILVDLGSDTQRFDVLPLLIATDGALNKLGYDTRRFRPNIVIGGVEGDTERSWPGARLHLGRVEIRVAQLRMRCVMTTFDPDTLKQDRSVLKRIVTENAGTLALDCSVLEAGCLTVGDAVSVLQ